MNLSGFYLCCFLTMYNIAAATTGVLSHYFLCFLQEAAEPSAWFLTMNLLMSSHGRRAVDGSCRGLCRCVFIVSITCWLNRFTCFFLCNCSHSVVFILNMQLLRRFYSFVTNRWPFYVIAITYLALSRAWYFTISCFCFAVLFDCQYTFTTVNSVANARGIYSNA